MMLAQTLIALNEVLSEIEEDRRRLAERSRAIQAIVDSIRPKAAEQDRGYAGHSNAFGNIGHHE